MNNAAAPELALGDASATERAIAAFTSMARLLEQHRYGEAVKPCRELNSLGYSILFRSVRRRARPPGGAK